MKMKLKKRFGQITHKGFTLVELLVVISIIAMLLAVLMPALSKAREQAKVTMCLANCKQLGVIIATYRTEYDGRVPIILNRWASNPLEGTNYPVKYLYISLGLRNYDSQTKNLPSELSPEGKWGLRFEGQMATYVDKYLPNYYVCPFARGKATMAETKDEGTVTVNGKEFTRRNFKGKFESFSTFMYGLIKDEDMGSTHATGCRPKYAALPWNCTSDNGNAKPDLQNNMVWERRPHFRNKKNTDGSRMEIKFSSLSEVMISYCVQGESRDFDPGLTRTPQNIIFNHKSHRKQTTGGSNAIFADTHAAWVPGDSIGWH
jgi:prepilin-type N-terminal cleavage/methylation domain-containing protein